MTKEIVKKVFGYKTDAKYNQLSNKEIGLLRGLTESTVDKICTGGYNHLLVGSDAGNGATTIIPLEDLKHLLACEYAISALLKMCKLSNNIDGALFIDFKATFSILRAYLPEEVNKRLEELQKGENENG